MRETEKIKMPKEFWDDERWAEENYTELQKRFRDMWVAIVDKRIIAYGKNLADVEEKARLETGKKHISVTFSNRTD